MADVVGSRGDCMLLSVLHGKWPGIGRAVKTATPMGLGSGIVSAVRRQAAADAGPRVRPPTVRVPCRPRTERFGEKFDHEQWEQQGEQPNA